MNEGAKVITAEIAQRVHDAAIALLGADKPVTTSIALPTGDTITLERDAGRAGLGVLLVFMRPATERREAAKESVWLGADRIRQTSISRIGQILEGFCRQVSPWRETLVGGEHISRTEFISRYDPYDRGDSDG